MIEKKTEHATASKNLVEPIVGPSEDSEAAKYAGFEEKEPLGRWWQLR